jgi:hypothetical protein
MMRRHKQSRAIIDEELLEEFRLPGLCELCDRFCRVREPHHLASKGSGGWSRFDLRYLLISLGSTAHFQCDCHRQAQEFRISRERVFEVVAQRENISVEFIEAEINRLRWGPV